MTPAMPSLAQMLLDAVDERDDARACIAAVRALCTARVPHPDRGAVPGQVYEATLRVRLIDTDAVLAALDGDAAGMLTDPDAEDPHDWWRSLDQDPIASADSLMEHAPDTARAVARYDAASVARVRRLLRDAYRRKTLRTDDVRAAIEGDRP